ncbi:hypothetical protein BB558_004804 [Smittium angustum]|uniref:Gfd2/YDR514C-like C-terminal domain-containing protein n=1 Tax=Smittium angustum TaxID=133377 RepID=A0A2U1J2B9_SMIAN|nr:hypothetical protein BB558_004804 [Smittium angustum]
MISDILLQHPRNNKTIHVLIKQPENFNKSLYTFYSQTPIPNKPRQRGRPPIDSSFKKRNQLQRTTKQNYIQYKEKRTLDSDYSSDTNTKGRKLKQSKTTHNMLGNSSDHESYEEPKSPSKFTLPKLKKSDISEIEVGIRRYTIEDNDRSKSKELLSKIIQRKNDSRLSNRNNLSFGSRNLKQINTQNTTNSAPTLGNKSNLNNAELNNSLDLGSQNHGNIQQSINDLNDTDTNNQNQWNTNTESSWPLTFSNEWPPSEKSKTPQEEKKEWPNMRTDNQINSSGKPGGVRIESKIPLLIGAMTSKRAKKLYLGSQLSHSQAKQSAYKKSNPQSTGDLENWCIVSEAERVWVRACKKEESKKSIRMMLRSPGLYLNSERQCAIASRKGEQIQEIAIDWVSMDLVRQQLEIETDELLPSIRQQQLGYVDIQRISDKDDLEQVRNFVRKNNQKVQKQESNNSKLRQVFAQWHKLQNLESMKTHGFVAIDCEMWEDNHNYLTEIGWVLYNSRTSQFLSRHYIVAEHYYLENKRNLSDTKDKFLYGQSVVAPLKICLEKLVNDIQSCMPIVVVGHDMGLDLQILKKHGIDFAATLNPPTTPSAYEDNNGNVPSSEKVSIVDTSMLYMGLISSFDQKPSLSLVLKHYGISTMFPHNAGNDAVYTMLAFLNLVRDEVPLTLGRPSFAFLGDVADVSITTDLLGKKDQQGGKSNLVKSMTIQGVEKTYESMFGPGPDAFKSIPVYKKTRASSEGLPLTGNKNNKNEPNKVTFSSIGMSNPKISDISTEREINKQNNKTRSITNIYADSENVMASTPTFDYLTFTDDANTKRTGGYSTSQPDLQSTFDYTNVVPIEKSSKEERKKMFQSLHSLDNNSVYQNPRIEQDDYSDGNLTDGSQSQNSVLQNGYEFGYQNQFGQKTPNFNHNLNFQSYY